MFHARVFAHCSGLRKGEALVPQAEIWSGIFGPKRKAAGFILAVFVASRAIVAMLWMYVELCGGLVTMPTWVPNGVCRVVRARFAGDPLSRKGMAMIPSACLAFVLCRAGSFMFCLNSNHFYRLSQDFAHLLNARACRHVFILRYRYEISLGST
jgi:hypothetical protein